MAVTNYIWDELSDNLLMETDENNVPTAVYTHWPERFGELISQERSGVTSYFHYDGAHSTRFLTDDNENITDTYIFSAFGELVARTGTTTNPFGYKGAVGYYTNPATNDIYVRARSYQPVTGRWLSMDPLGFVDGPNLYRAYFVPGGVDPSGQMERPFFCQPATWKDIIPGTGSRDSSGFSTWKANFVCEVSCMCRDGSWRAFTSKTEFTDGSLYSAQGLIFETICQEEASSYARQLNCPDSGGQDPVEPVVRPPSCYDVGPAVPCPGPEYYVALVLCGGIRGIGAGFRWVWTCIRRPTVPPPVIPISPSVPVQPLPKFLPPARRAS